jgi:hypothetical protein
VLLERVPGLPILGIARRPGVLSKVAIEPGWRVSGDDIAFLRDQLDGERVEVITRTVSPERYIADALGLSELPPMVLLPSIQHAHVLLGEIDLLGVRGWRDLNVVLASSLTGWRIRLKPIAATLAWQRLRRAMEAGTLLAATVVGAARRGSRVEVGGLYARLPGPVLPLGCEVEVRVRRMDADEGRIVVSDRARRRAQPALL